MCVCVCVKNTHTRGSALLPGARGGDRPLGGLRRRPIRGATTRAPCKTVYYYNIVVVVVVSGPRECKEEVFASPTRATTE